MLIYTSTANGDKLEKAGRLGMGLLLAARPEWICKDHAKLPTALDNGAYQYWRRGLPFIEQPFRESIRKAWECGLDLDFIVCPDLVARGRDSLRYSVEWATGELRSAPRLALAVQDGMTQRDILDTGHLRRFTHIFVGGTTEWKWKTAEDWVRFAHEHGLSAHIGRCGQLHHLERAREVGADSVDSASFARNDSWHIVERFLGQHQQCFPFGDGTASVNAVQEGW